MPNTVIHLFQTLPTLSDIHLYIGEPLKWAGAPALAAAMVVRAAYGSRYHTVAFFVAAIACLVCFADNLLVSHGLIPEGETVDLAFSTASGLLCISFAVLFCLRLHIKEASAVLGTAGLSVLIPKLLDILPYIKISQTGDEVLSTLGMAAACACFTAWASRYSVARMICVAMTSAIVVMNQYSFWSHDILMTDVMRISELVLALLLTVGTFDEDKTRDDSKSNGNHTSDAVLA